VPARLEVGGLPWTMSDVYVYLDAPMSASQDASLGAYTLNGTTRFARNSMVNTDQLGDWPTYDTWVGWREATATSATAPVAAQLGNYIVFRGVSGTAFTLNVETQRPLNAVQIIESGGSTAGNQAPVILVPSQVEPAVIAVP
jgi:hypothetical protein